ncbi:MAG TPA: hypothetical protein VFF38_03720 [Microvirga sp.]|nr:hypothetical protein [Microvirga sp.]
MELPLAIGALDAPARTEPFASQLEGRARRPLGDLFGLKNFGVNLAALETVLGPGMCAGFKAGHVSHHFEGRSAGPIIYLGTGDRTKGDELSDPAEDLVGALRLQGWAFRQKDGTPH